MPLERDLTLAKNLAAWLVKEGVDSALVEQLDTGTFLVTYSYHGVLQSRKAPTPISS